MRGDRSPPSRSPAAGATSSAPTRPPRAATSSAPPLADVFWHLGGIVRARGGDPARRARAHGRRVRDGRERDPAARALVATAAAWTIAVVRGGRDVRLPLGRPRRGARPAHGRAAALPRLRPLAPPRRAARPARGRGSRPSRSPRPSSSCRWRDSPCQEAALDAFSFIPLWRLAEATSTATLELLFPLAGGGARGGRGARPPPGDSVVLPALVAIVLVGLSIRSTREIARLSALDRAWVFDTGDPRWLDAAADRPGRPTCTGRAFPAGVWKHAFWNRRIESVAPAGRRRAARSARPGGSRVAAGRRAQQLGRAPSRRHLVAAPAELALAGERIAQAPRSTDLAGLALWRADPPLRARHLAHRRAAERRHHRPRAVHGLPLRRAAGSS